MAEPFYHAGLHFECTQCHACCRHDPGFVFLGQQDLDRLSRRFSMSREAFVQKYTRWIDSDRGKILSLLEKKNFDCIFWSQGCQVYEDRPIQCSTYPFWKTPMKSEENWRWEGRFCPGIQRGPLHSREEIEQALAAREAQPPITFEEWEARS